MSNASDDPATTRYACPTCQGPLVAQEAVKGKGGDWRMLSCPACEKSYKWRASRFGIGFRVFMITIAIVYWMMVPLHDTFDVVVHLLALAMIAWAIVTLVRMWRTGAKWARNQTT